MASLLNRNGIYYADFYDSNRKPSRRRHSLKTRTKRTADRLLSRLEAAYREGTWDAWTESPEDLFHADHAAEAKTVGEAVPDFIQHKRETCAATTVKAYASYLRFFTEMVGSSTYIERVTADDVAGYVHGVGESGREPSANTQRQRLTVAQSFFSWAKANGYAKEKPTDAVDRPAKPEKLPKAVTDDELEALLDAIPEGIAWAKPLFRFAAVTGLRVSELGRLRWEDVDTEQRLLKIERQKNGKAQTQPIPHVAVEILETVERIGPYVFTSPNAYRKRRIDSWIRNVEVIFSQARDSAGISRHITPHGLRHRYCTKLAEAGANAFVIQAAARHADIHTSQRYVSIANETLRTELDGVFR